MRHLRIPVLHTLRRPPDVSLRFGPACNGIGPSSWKKGSSSWNESSWPASANRPTGGRWSTGPRGKRSCGSWRSGWCTTRCPTAWTTRRSSWPGGEGSELPYGVPEEDRGGWEDQEVQLLADALRPWREKYPQVRVLEDVRLFTPAHALIQRSAGAELVVVGRGSGGEPGSTARELLRESVCPVAAVPK
ncbi:universal stress protein [Streptomyces sp. NPDC001928]|uniref:universal stress protein n=1 Tax=Streptomyces sp. NPDC001928 TaxID=3154404 RepID=UPI00331AB7FC